MESRPLSINISSIHISGVGGLGMVAMVVVMALAIPLAALVLVGSAVGGALAAGLPLALAGRWICRHGPTAWRRGWPSATENAWDADYRRR